MKPLLILIAFLLHTGLSAQEFDVRSFQPVPEDMAARRFEKLDVNGNPAALIKVVTNIPGMQFETNLGYIEVEPKDEGYWVYVPERDRRLRIMAAGYLAKDLSLPESARSHAVYELVVAATGTMPAMADLVNITFRMNEDNVYIRSGQNAPVLSAGSSTVYSVPRGSHTFRFIKQGFQELERTIEATEDQTIDINLQRGATTTTLTLPGFIVINSEPAGAEVYLNEQRVGVTPYQGRQLAGAYNLMLRLPLYYDHIEPFNLAEGATVNLPTISLNPRFGYFSVSSIPPGAEVLLDGKLLGTTPLARGQISSGMHELKLRLPLYHEHTETFTIADGDDKPFNIALNPAFGQLSITSEPTGAEVFIDGRRVGTTPYENGRQPSGNYNLRLSKELHSDANEQITIRDGQRSERFIPLNRNYGTLQVNAPDATIFVNGRREGFGSINLKLTSGSYRLKSTRDKHIDDEREVFVVVGQTESISLNPRPRMGALSIISQPFQASGAEIYINNEKRRETTPAVIPLLIGNYEVRLNKSGYLEATQSIEVRENREHELLFEMQTFEGSLAQQARKYRNAKIIYGAGALLSAGAGAYFMYSSDQLSKEYPKATTDATAMYNRMEQHQLIAYIAFGAVVPLTAMYFVKSSHQKRILEKMDIVLLPIGNGTFFTLSYNF